MLMTYRPMSQMVRIFLVPEIERRVGAGMLAADQFSFQVYQFRFLQGDGQNLSCERVHDVLLAPFRQRVAKPRHRFRARDSRRRRKGAVIFQRRQRSDLNAALTSLAKISGCSQAAKCPPFSSRL